MHCESFPVWTMFDDTIFNGCTGWLHCNLLYHSLGSLWQPLTSTVLFSPFTFPKRKQKHKWKLMMVTPPNRYSPLSFSQLFRAPVLRKWLLERFLHLGAGTSHLGKGSSCSQLSFTAPGMPDLSQGFDLATSCQALTGQGCCQGGKEEGGGEQGAKDPPWAARQSPDHTQNVQLGELERSPT